MRWERAEDRRFDGKFGLLLGLLFSSLDASIVGTSLVTISVELQDFRNSPWVALSYLLAYMGFAVLFAKLSDIYGRRTLLAVAWILFTAFSLGCGLAANMPSLIIFRAIQGVGGSGLYSLAQVCLFEVGPSNKPSLLGALVGMTLAVSFVLGPVLGGTITRFATWSWIFYINIPFGILALLGLAFAWPPNKKSEPLGLWEISRKFNICGNILMISASGLLVYALQEAGSFNYAWNSPAIIATLSVAAVSWVLFIGREFFLVRRRNRYIDPVFPTRLIIQRPFLAALSCSFLAGFTYLALIIILPERFQIVNGDDSLMAGVHLLPQLGACAFGSFLAGAVSSKRNNTAVTLIVAHCLQLIGIGLLSTLSDVHTAIEAQYGYQAIFGLGVGLSFASVTILTSVRSLPEDLAVAQGAIAQARVFGGALGITICMIIVNKHIQTGLGDELGSSDMSALQRDPVTISYFPPDIQALVRKTYAGAFTNDIKVMIGVTAVGLLVSLFSFEVDPPLMPGHQAPKEDVLV
ncbi:putative Major facilitator superfamily (MFS) profile domain-containing protein [Seiridium cardinale]|uniref:Major facilitator superfamily (MFS) profile domain-containing protein n=1 Tax=Seiridium cardinale TaxID=138064 RepID=A0ABR2Y1F8_9PEZI